MDLNESVRTFGAEVFRLRMEKGITQAALALRVSVSPGYLSAIENDRVPPPAAAICGRLAVELCGVGEQGQHLQRLAHDQKQAWRVRLPSSLAAPVADLITELLVQQKQVTPQKVHLIRQILARGGAP